MYDPMASPWGFQKFGFIKITFQQAKYPITCSVYPSVRYLMSIAILEYLIIPSFFGCQGFALPGFPRYNHPIFLPTLRGSKDMNIGSNRKFPCAEEQGKKTRRSAKLRLFTVGFYFLKELRRDLESEFNRLIDMFYRLIIFSV